MLILIAAMSENRVIGCGNTIPWKVPGEQKLFKELTTGHTVIMGRKTYESIGRVLPNRRNIVVSSQPGLQYPGCEMAKDVDSALVLAGETADKKGILKTFIIGGAQLYRQTLARADAVYLTVVPLLVEGDAFFPELDEREFKLENSQHYDFGKPFQLRTYHRRVI